MRITQTHKKIFETPKAADIKKTDSITEVKQATDKTIEDHVLPPMHSYNFLEVEDVSKMLAESIRGSFLVRNLDKTELDQITSNMEQEGGMDQNSIRLKNIALKNPRSFLSKKGPLEVEDKNQACCMIGFSRTSSKKMCLLDKNVLSIETRKEAPFYLCFDTVNLDVKKIS
jgi:hypothetical protein